MTQITAVLTDGMVVTLSNGRHEWSADEPLSAGGTDTGPNPYELLLGSLAACTCVTIAWYCRHKGLPLDEVRVHLSHDKTYKEDCEDSENKGAKIDKISRTIELDGDLDAAQRQRMLEIADRCPVHKTLHNEIVVESKLKSLLRIK